MMDLQMTSRSFVIPPLPPLPPSAYDKTPATNLPSKVTKAYNSKKRRCTKVSPTAKGGLFHPPGVVTALNMVREHFPAENQHVQLIPEYMENGRVLYHRCMDNGIPVPSGLPAPTEYVDSEEETEEETQELLRLHDIAFRETREREERERAEQLEEQLKVVWYNALEQKKLEQLKVQEAAHHRAMQAQKRRINQMNADQLARRQINLQQMNPQEPLQQLQRMAAHNMTAQQMAQRNPQQVAQQMAQSNPEPIAQQMAQQTPHAPRAPRMNAPAQTMFIQMTPEQLAQHMMFQRSVAPPIQPTPRVPQIPAQQTQRVHQMSAHSVQQVAAQMRMAMEGQRAAEQPQTLAEALQPLQAQTPHVQQQMRPAPPQFIITGPNMQQFQLLQHQQQLGQQQQRQQFFPAGMMAQQAAAESTRLKANLPGVASGSPGSKENHLLRPY